MPFPYAIEELIEDSNRALFTDVSNKVGIKLVQSKSSTWSAKLNENVAIIEFSESAYPIPSFTHELLHIKLELDGLVCPQFIDNEEIGGELIGWLFNQLCHHKMYPLYIAMNYPPNQFLNDFDQVETSDLLTSSLVDLERVHQENNTVLNGLPVLLPYLVIKSPNENPDNIQQYSNRLIQIADPIFLSQIDRIIQEWVNSVTLDSSLIYAKIFNVCNRPRIGFCITGSEDDLIVAGNIAV